MPLTVARPTLTQPLRKFRSDWGARKKTCGLLDEDEAARIFSFFPKTSCKNCDAEIEIFSCPWKTPAKATEMPSWTGGRSLKILERGGLEEPEHHNTPFKAGA
jgi:hypothetical protein